jgi:hypothetical protein
MNDLIIEGKHLGKTPTIEFKVNGELKISGRSIPEDSRIFYQPVFSWLETLKLNLPSKIEMKVALEYFNTSSSILLLNLFNSLVQLHQDKQTKVNIIWYYHEDDDEMQEAGRDYKSIVRVPFEVVSMSV